MFELMVLSVTLSDGPIRERLRELRPDPPSPAKTLTKAAELLTEMDDKAATRIPEALLAKAEAVVIIPDTVKAGFIVAGRGGHGVAMVRAGDGWGEPTFVNLGGVSFGAQLGAQATDLVLVFKSKKSLERILDGKGKLTLGVDAGVAAGPVGRRAEASTDGQFKAEVLSYSRSRGLFAGVSMDGGVLAPATEANKAFTKEATKDDLQAAENLKAKLMALAGMKELPKAVEPKPAGGGKFLGPPLVAPPTVTPPPTVPDTPPVKKDK
jgi:lipid-binding SYLF domain-containing protein